MLILRLNIEQELVARIQKVAQRKDTTIEGMVLKNLVELAAQDYKREEALRGLSAFIARLDDCNAARPVRPTKKRSRRKTDRYPL